MPTSRLGRIASRAGGRTAGVALLVWALPTILRAAVPVPSPISTLHWRLVGPYRAGWSEMVEGVVSQPDTFYFAAAGGGVWKSPDAGRTWTSLFDRGPTAPIGAIAVAPSDPETLYIGSGQPEPRYDVAGGAGVFSSKDGGRTWRPLGLEKTRHIGRILVKPGDPNTVLVAAVGDFFSSGPDRGVFRTTDGGRTWSQTLKIDPETGAADLAADPKDSRTVFAAAWQARQYPWQSYFTPVAGPGSGLYRSDDGGVTWRRLGGQGWPAGPLGRISLAVTRTVAGLRIYAVISAADAGGLYRSDDGGDHWIRVNDDQAFTSYYASRVTVAPDDPDVVWLVGQSVRRCSNGGRTCEIVKGAPGGDDYHFVWINPAHPDHMAVASDQGTVVSVDGGASWSSWYNQPTGQFYHIAVDDRFPYRIYAGQQDSGTVEIASRGDYGAISDRDWRSVGGDERDYELPDPADPDIVYGSGLGGRVTRFDARTGQVANITPYPVPNYGQRPTETAHHFVWVTPLAIGPTRPHTLYLGGEVVFASSDGGGHWKIISPDLTGKTAGAERCGGEVAVADAKACGYGGIWSLAPSPRNAGELWVGADDGLVQLTRDGGAHWTDITPRGLPPWAKVSSIDVSPNVDGDAVIAVDNHRQGDRSPRIWRTVDYGASWREAAGDLPTDHFVSVVRADPVRDGLLYAGTDVGVFISFDFGSHWRRLGDNLPTAWVRDLLVHGDDLIAATQGRAIWILGDLALLRQAGGGMPAGALRLFRPADAWRVRPNDNHGDTPLPPEEKLGENPPGGAVIDYWLAALVKGPMNIEIRDASGALVRRLTNEPSSALPANRYFAPAWARRPRPLSGEAGPHSVVWDLRYERPAAIRYDYSIATVAGGDTPLTPQGPLAPPGLYHLSLTAEGKVARTSLRVLQDPRSPASETDLAASLALSRRIGASLALARRGYGEQAAVRKQLTADLAIIKSRGDTPLAARVANLIERIGAPRGGPTFLTQTGVLTGIETDLEGADLAPTQAQLETAAEAGGR
ncbi:MAG: WD40/YVTN/BNR-like repeat-containing protein, partial [Caulobacteraceae bacterium]